MITVAMFWPKNNPNIAVLARTCEAAGAHFVTSSSTSRRTIMNNINTPKYPPMYVDEEDISRWIRSRAGAKGHHVFAIETGGQNVSAYPPQWFEGDDITLILGHESKGTPEWILNHDSIATVTLPQVGRGGSINVSVAGSIALYWFSGLMHA